jgi:TPP-dependent pyruvate/acetoin dehydrogenase alpha subunit
MAKTASSRKKSTAKAESPAIDKSILLAIYRKIYATRQFELKCIELYRQGLIYGYLHPYLGEEAVAAGACAAIQVDDYIVSTHRGHGHCISKDADLKLMMAEIMGRATGYCKGRGGSMHISSSADHNLGANGIVGAGLPIGCGAGLAIKVKKKRQAVVVFFGDGGTNNGVFGESLNFAAALNLPVIFVLENNHYAVSTPIEFSAGGRDLSKLGPAYGMPGISVDGNDGAAVFTATKRAVERARRDEGPSLIEAKTFRHGGHHVNDPGLYMDQDALQKWKARDPLALMRARLGESEAFEIEKSVDEELEAAVEYAKNSPEPSVQEFLADVQE